MPVTNNTRRYPRTLQEAFGPYTSNVIHTDTHARRRDTVAAVVCALLVVVLGSWIVWSTR